MNGPFLLGLTGSIGMGKSTTAQMFADAGIPIWDADAAVHQLYTDCPTAIGAIADKFPSAIQGDKINRAALAKIIADNPTHLADLEEIVHPLIAQNRRDFTAKHSNAKLIVFDIPLIYEKKLADEFDAVVVVSTDAQTQQTRILARDNMTVERMEMIMDNQMPDSKKRTLADYIIETKTLDHARAQVHNLIEQITGTPPHA